MKRLILIACLGLVSCGPWGGFPGGRLYGQIASAPVGDWSFTEEHQLIAVETRPAFPHSVTTICFTHQGQLYVPSRSPLGKKWPRYALEDPRVRLKIGEKIYLGRAVRVSDADLLPGLGEAIGQKYPRFAGTDTSEADAFWFFRIDPRG